MKKEILFPCKTYDIACLKAGEEILVSGTIYTARDAAHKKILQAIDNGREPPFNVEGQLIYYTGPTPAPPGKIIGSCGPTTSSRMDGFTLPLMQAGLKASMGKGRRSEIIAKGCKKYSSLYLITYGGCGAYLNRFIKKSKLIAYPELGTEAILRLTVEKFPAIVGIDTQGNAL